MIRNCFWFDLCAVVLNCGLVVFLIGLGLCVYCYVCVVWFSLTFVFDFIVLGCLLVVVFLYFSLLV